ncbi:MAG TPA: SAM-dependent methyltransferase [Gaiellaceae bacterium]|nr:SAM-dependent methyltransferase [Gaiellaceae bacterium]
MSTTSFPCACPNSGDLDYHRLAQTPGTLVIFMGLGRLEHIADNLILAGRPVDEPVAVISRLSLPDMEIHLGTLATITASAKSARTPALVVIGDVVREPRTRHRTERRQRIEVGSQRPVPAQRRRPM